MTMIKNKIIALSCALLMATGSVRPTETADISATRKNLSKVFHVAALASVVPTCLVLQSMYATNTSDKILGAAKLGEGKLAKVKLALVASVPLVLQVISDFIAKNSKTDMFWNVAKISAGESAAYLFMRGPESSVYKKLEPLAQKLATLGNKK